MELVLASESPRRRELLALVTPHFITCSAHINEAALAADTPAQLALQLAKAKAQTAAGNYPHALVVGCDTVVELNGKALGKPANAAQATSMLQALSGTAHQVHTGVALVCKGVLQNAFVETTQVTFALLPQVAIQAYVQTQEPYDKAGGYGIQGWAAKYIPHINGCYYNVMGLPVAALHRALQPFLPNQT